MTKWKWRHDQLLKRLHVLENRLGFATMEIGACHYCQTGNKPGAHHDKRCELWRKDDI